MTQAPAMSMETMPFQLNGNTFTNAELTVVTYERNGKTINARHAWALGEDGRKHHLVRNVMANAVADQFASELGLYERNAYVSDTLADGVTTNPDRPVLNAETGEVRVPGKDAAIRAAVGGAAVAAANIAPAAVTHNKVNITNADQEPKGWFTRAKERLNKIGDRIGFRRAAGAVALVATLGITAAAIGSVERPSFAETRTETAADAPTSTSTTSTTLAPNTASKPSSALSNAAKNEIANEAKADTVAAASDQDSTIAAGTGTKTEEADAATPTIKMEALTDAERIAMAPELDKTLPKVPLKYINDLDAVLKDAIETTKNSMNEGKGWESHVHSINGLYTMLSDALNQRGDFTNIDPAILIESFHKKGVPQDVIDLWKEGDINKVNSIMLSRPYMVDAPTAFYNNIAYRGTDANGKEVLAYDPSRQVGANDVFLQIAWRNADGTLGGSVLVRMDCLMQTFDNISRPVARQVVRRHAAPTHHRVIRRKPQPEKPKNVGTKQDAHAPGHQADDHVEQDALEGPAPVLTGAPEKGPEGHVIPGDENKKPAVTPQPKP